MEPSPTPPSIAEVVRTGLCVGCGLCEAVAPDRVSMQMSSTGSLHPVGIDRLSAAEERVVQGACPGIVAEARPDPVTSSPVVDEVWGAWSTMVMGWAGDPDVRFRASTGGVLTALGMHLLQSGTVRSILHVGPDPDAPMRSVSRISTEPTELLDNAGSRYGPSAPLTQLAEILDQGEPFGVIAKPCDLGAIHRLAATDHRVDELCRARLAMVCGGQSKLSKSLKLLDDFGVDEHDVSLFRYRGYGNPGPTRVEATDGRSFEKTYLELWEDEGTWDLETRCKLCPDALGEAADISASDAWPGGAPTTEDEGFNGLIVRTAAGEALWTDALAAGAVVEGDPLTPREFDDLQPHQVRKKVALASRYAGMVDAGVTPIHTIGLRVDALGRRLDADRSRVEREGTAVRLRR